MPADTANNLSVTISAVDKTSAAIEAVAKRLSGVTAPARNVEKSLARLSDASGVTKLSKAITTLGGNTARAGVRMTEALSPLGTLTAALSAAGMGRMVSDWARFSQRLGFDATRIGTNISTLHALEGSARLSGASAEAAAGGLRTLQDTLTDATGGRNMQAVVYLRQLGVAFDDGAGHALRATQVLPKLADRLKTISDRSIRARVGTALLGGAYEELAPWIDRGSAGMAEYAEMARRYGVNTEQSKITAETFRYSQTQLTLALEGLGNSISEKVSPALASLMGSTADWIGKNRDMMALDVKGWSEDYASAFRTIGGVVDKAVTSTVGWNRALEFGIPLMVSRTIPPLARLENAIAKLALIRLPVWLAKNLGRLAPLLLTGPAGGEDAEFSRQKNDEFLANRARAQQKGSAGPATLGPWRQTLAQRMMGYFEGQGWTHAQAAGLVANLTRESGLDASRTGDSGAAYGLAQWHPDRQARFKAWSGHDIQGSTLDEQMQFVQWELTHNEKAAGDHLRMAQNPVEAAYVVSGEYERPKDKAGEATIRGEGAQQFAALPAVKVDVNIAGLPHGSQATATTSGAAQAGVKVVRAMP